MDSTTTANKRKHEVTETEEMIESQRPRQEQQEEVVDLLNIIPSVALRHVLSFLSPLERFPLALTCKAGLELVETFSNDVMQKIYDRYCVDNTFESRIRWHYEYQLGDDYSRQNPQNQYSDRQVPHRIRLWAGLKSHLFTLKTDYTGKSWLHVKVSPSGKFLVVATSHRVELWDLSKRKCVQTHTGTIYRQVFFCGDGNFVICGMKSISVISLESGKLHIEHQLPQGQYCVNSYALIKDRLFYSQKKNDGATSLRMMDVHNGIETILDALLPKEVLQVLRNGAYFSLSVLDDRWLIVHHEKAEASSPITFHVLDSENGFERVGYYRSSSGYFSFHPLGQLSVAGHRRVLGVNDPRCVDIFVFDPAARVFGPTYSFTMDPELKHLVGIHGQCLCSRALGRGRNPLFLHDTETGERRGSFHWFWTLGHGGATRSAYSNKQEQVYVGIDLVSYDSDSDARRESHVAVFLAKEPSLDDNDDDTALYRPSSPSETTQVRLYFGD